MTHVDVGKEWFLNQAGVDNFLQWADTEVGNENWSFKANHNLDCGVFSFASNTDALIFKLKFNV